MDVYAESSAILAWLLDDGPEGVDVAATLQAATSIATSDLTLIECDRVLARAAALHEITEADAATRHARLEAAAAHWIIFAVEEEVVARARRPFPVEPIRTLDAIHVATALIARRFLPTLAMLSLDERVRRVSDRLGLPLLPAD
jgi:hypothetical protein